MSTIFDRLELRMEMTGLSGIARGLVNTGNQMETLGLLAAVGFGIQAVAALAKTRVEVEKLNAQLSALYGTAGGSEANRFIMQFATRTHQNIADVREEFLALSERGIQPTVHLLRDIESLSISSGESMKTVAEAVASAFEGETGALKKFGIELRKGESWVQIMAQIDNHVSKTQSSMGMATKAVNDLANAWADLKETASGPVTILLGAMAELATLLRGALYLVNVFAIGLKTSFDEIGYSLSKAMALFDRFVHMNKDAAGWEKRAANYWKNIQADEAALSPGKIPKLNDQAKEPGGFTRGFLRQFIGGGDIGQIGVRGTELPGLGRIAGQAPIRVQVETRGKSFERIVQDAVNETLNKLNMHGALNLNPVR